MTKGTNHFPDAPSQFEQPGEYCSHCDERIATGTDMKQTEKEASGVLTSLMDFAFPMKSERFKRTSERNSNIQAAEISLPKDVKLE
jgi:hypothetical protein